MLMSVLLVLVLTGYHYLWSSVLIPCCLLHSVGHSYGVLTLMPHSTKQGS